MPALVVGGNCGQLRASAVDGENIFTAVTVHDIAMHGGHVAVTWARLSRALRGYYQYTVLLHCSIALFYYTIATSFAIMLLSCTVLMYCLMWVFCSIVFDTVLIHRCVTMFSCIVLWRCSLVLFLALYNCYFCFSGSCSNSVFCYIVTLLCGELPISYTAI